KGIGKVEFEKKDIVRHQLVQRIVEAYEKHDALRKAGLLDDTGLPVEDQPETAKNDD
ncbi:MAG: PhoH family protein, partial [Muribaculaceae bacterium]|nr:PhoH family protein [Muribaculaceae bacterium]